VTEKRPEQARDKIDRSREWATSGMLNSNLLMVVTEIKVIRGT
jgi:hypothetical protein